MNVTRVSHCPENTLLSLPYAEGVGLTGILKVSCYSRPGAAEVGRVGFPQETLPFPPGSLLSTLARGGPSPCSSSLFLLHLLSQEHSCSSAQDV